MANKVWLLIIAAIASSITYRIGGKGGFKNAKAVRRFGCSLIALIAIWITVGFDAAYWWVYPLTYILQALALSTYWDTIFSPDKNDENWACWLATGAGYSLATLPLMFTGVHWYAIAGRSIVLGLSIMGLRERTGKDWLEEIGSGALLILTIPILTI